MSGPQFANIQTYSRKASKAGNSVDQVIAEAIRDPEYSLHVDAPQPPRVLIGDPSTFKEDHDTHVADRATTVFMPDQSVRSRAIRQDRHTMLSIVMSYPVPHSAITTDEAKAKLAAWEDRNIKWLQKKFGSQLRVVIAHDDEKQPHLHAWILPDNPDADATMLHPGKQAKKTEEFEAKEAGIENRLAVKMGNVEYKKAMTEWQNEYHEAVGIPEGLTRSGPRRQRLSRDQWKSQKEAAKAAQSALERAKDAESRADEIEEREQETRTKADTLTKVHGRVMRDKEKLSARESAVSAREEAIDAKERQSTTKAAQIISDAHTDAQTIRDDADALHAETVAECMKMASDVHEKARGFMTRVKDVISRIGSAFGLDLLGKDLLADIAEIESALTAAENTAPDADRDGPGF